MELAPQRPFRLEWRTTANQITLRCQPMAVFDPKWMSANCRLPAGLVQISMFGR